MRDENYSEVMAYVQERVDLDGAADVYVDEDIRTSGWDFEVLGEDDDENLRRAVFAETLTVKGIDTSNGTELSECLVIGL